MINHQLNILTVLICAITPLVVGEWYQNDFRKSLIVDHCDKIYSLACFKLDAATWLDRFGINNEINVIPGVSFLQSPNSVKLFSSDIAAEVAREFPEDEKSRVDNFLFRKLADFLSNHSLKLNLWNAVHADSDVSGRKDKDKKGDGGMSMVLIAGAMMIGVLTALAMGGLTALAGKALLTGLVSFVISAIIGLKQLTSSKEKTYITKPVPAYSSHLYEEWDEFADHSRSGQKHALPKGLQDNYKPS